MLKDLKDYTAWLFRWLGAICLAMVVISMTPLGRDDTDPGDWGARSNLHPRTDSATGCQYLVAPGGGITPRLDGRGRHVGCGA